MKRSTYQVLSFLFAIMFLAVQSPILIHAENDIGVVEGRIVNVYNPINEQDVATKNYVDNSIDMLPSPPTVLQTTGQSTTAVMSQKAVTDAIWPVGSIYMSVSSTDPGDLFGGTWVLWGAGRVPVCVSVDDTEFNTVEKTGGHKLMQSHKHNILQWVGNYEAGATNLDDCPGAGNHNTPSKVVFGSGTEYTGGGNAENLQPYITCYMWKRIA